MENLKSHKSRKYSLFFFLRFTKENSKHRCFSVEFCEGITPMHFPVLEKEMATHSSVLAWRIPGTRSLVGCRLWGRTESDTTEAT